MNEECLLLTEECLHTHNSSFYSETCNLFCVLSVPKIFTVVYCDSYYLRDINIIICETEISLMQMSVKVGWADSRWIFSEWYFINHLKYLSEMFSSTAVGFKADLSLEIESLFSFQRSHLELTLSCFHWLFHRFLLFFLNVFDSL